MVDVYIKLFMLNNFFKCYDILLGMFIKFLKIVWIFFLFGLLKIVNIYI